MIPMPREPPHPGALRKQIAELARDGAISWGTHSLKERSPERGIDINDARRVLKIGEIMGPIEPGLNAGEWKCKVVAKAEDRPRRIGVAVIVIQDRRLFIKTVEWEDK